MSDATKILHERYVGGDPVRQKDLEIARKDDEIDRLRADLESADESIDLYQKRVEELEEDRGQLVQGLDAATIREHELEEQVEGLEKKLASAEALLDAATREGVLGLALSQNMLLLEERGRYKRERDEANARLTALMEGLEVEHIDEMMKEPPGHFIALGEAIALQAKRVTALVEGVEEILFGMEDALDTDYRCYRWAKDSCMKEDRIVHKARAQVRQSLIPRLRDLVAGEEQNDTR